MSESKFADVTLNLLYLRRGEGMYIISFSALPCKRYHRRECLSALTLMWRDCVPLELLGSVFIAVFLLLFFCFFFFWLLFLFLLNTPIQIY